VLGLAATNVLGHGAGPVWHAVIGVVLVGLLALIAAWERMSPAELGLARDAVPRGLRLGAVCVAVVSVAGVVALVVPPARAALSDTSSDLSAGGALLTVFVLLPLGTVLPEEFAFRGVLWGLLHRHNNRLVATVVSSILFGFWHVLSALTGSPANQAAESTLGSGGGGTALRVAGTVLFTSLAGVVLCELRIRSGSLLAPIMLHWAVNGVGILLVLVA